MSNLLNPKNSLGVFEIPKSKNIDYNKLLILVNSDFVIGLGLKI